MSKLFFLPSERELLKKERFCLGEEVWVWCTGKKTAAKFVSLVKNDVKSVRFPFTLIKKQRNTQKLVFRVRGLICVRIDVIFKLRLSVMDESTSETGSKWLIV